MKVIVVTGSTRGIGYGLVDEFLKRGCAVVVSGRSSKAVEQAVQALSQHHDSARILGQACDIRDYSQVQALWDAPMQRFGKVDIWINNAGLSQDPKRMWELRPEQIQAVVATNVIGMMNACHVVMRGMAQQGYGFLYNMEGSGSQGNPMPKLIVYQTTKRALKFFTDGLLMEAKGTPVKVGYLSPGIVVTDMLFEGYSEADKERTKRIFNILADRVETVTPYLAEKVLENDKNGARIAWLKGPQFALRFLTAPFNKRDVFQDNKPL